MRAADQDNTTSKNRKRRAASPDPAEIVRRLKGNKRTPVHEWKPEHCGEIEMRIARDGTWFYQGTPIHRQPMVTLFSTVLRRDADSIFYLVTPVEKLAITVDDAPFVAVEMTVHGQDREQVLVFRTNVDDEVMAGPDNPIRLSIDAASQEPAPYILVRDRLEALIARAVFYDLVELGREEEHAGEIYLGVWSAGVFFPLARADELKEV